MCELVGNEWILCRACRCGENRRAEFHKRWDGLQSCCRVCQRAASASRQRAADRKFPVDGTAPKAKRVSASYARTNRIKGVFRDDFKRWLANLPILHPDWLAEYERLGAPPGPWGLGPGKWVLAGDVGSLSWMRWEETHARRP
jgi:hypothetical protein